MTNTLKYDNYFDTGSVNVGDQRWNYQAFQGLIMVVAGLIITTEAMVAELPAKEGAAPAGGMGDMVCTCLYKDDVFPIIRFQTHDVSREVAGDNPLGLPFREYPGSPMPSLPNRRSEADWGGDVLKRYVSFYLRSSF